MLLSYTRFDMLCGSHVMTARWRKIFEWAGVVLLPISCVIGSELYYAHRITPRGVSNVRDFFDRFGEPQRIRMLKRDGQNYYEFTGAYPKPERFS